jgi:endonuclease/exonuclease/phosphatase family metal-dependent hydrolase
VLSPHRLEQTARFTLRRAPFWDWRRRVGLVADIGRDDGRYSLIDLHLSPHDAAPERLREASAVLARAAGGQLPPVICGDLNDLPGEVAHTAFIEGGWIDAWHAVHGDEPGGAGATNWTAGPRAGRPPTQRIDYVLAPPGSTVEACDVAVDAGDVDRIATLSDHLPLIASMRIGRAP